MIPERGRYDSTPSVSFSYDADNRKASMTDTTGTTTYSYDNASRLTSRTAPQGTVTFAYNEANGAKGCTSLQEGERPPQTNILSA